MEHIEQAGVHSGDSACSIPPYSLSEDIRAQLREQAAKMAKALNVVGLMNAQFAIQGENIFIIEVNPRASRTVPYVSKATGIPLAKVAARCMVEKSLKEQGFEREIVPKHFCVKEAVFPFVKFPSVDPILGPEMKSTGEVMGVGTTFAEAYAKAQVAAGVTLPQGGTAFVSVRDADKKAVIPVAKKLLELGFQILATKGTADALTQAGIDCEMVYKVNEGRPHIVDMIKSDEINFIINTTEGKKAIADSRTIRSNALQRKVTYTTTVAGADATCLAMQHKELSNIYSLQDIHQELNV
jgi:carbamoyl-phosphate synthase large subunit